MCRELFKLARRGGAMGGGRPIAGTKFQQWYFFYTAAFWLYLRQVHRSTKPFAAKEAVRFEQESSRCLQGECCPAALHKSSAPCTHARTCTNVRFF